MKTNRLILNKIADIAYAVFFISLLFCVFCYGYTWKTTGIPNVMGYRHFYIASGSMEPTIREHQFILTETVDADEVEVGDIIAYRKEDMGIIIVHRVIDIRESENGELLFTAQGDNNENPDPYDITEDMILYKTILY